MSKQVYVLYMRHSNYEKTGSEGVDTVMYGVFEDKDTAFALLTAKAEVKRDSLIKEKGSENVYFTYDGEGYYELLDCEVGKYEWFVVPCEMNAVVEEAIT